ncbi:MAG: tyrosine-protein phosphatase [Alphaproteobacteria bacterium]|nr:tyrosine-protein phosphatase [Alphaproteobacteria bacterium]
MTQHFRRKHVFDGVRNFRDFGGYSAAGRHMVQGRFFRSANHALASDADLARMAEMGIGAIIDLRRPEERERMPSRRWEGFKATVVENHDNHEGHGEESWNGFMESWDLSTEGVRSYHLRYYERAPVLPRLIDLYTQYFRAVAETEGPIVVHCAAGKDRTGIIVALTHALAGVHRDDIMEDFLLTNDPAAFDVHGPIWAEELAKTKGRAPSREAMHVTMGVHEDYLDRAFAVIEERYGSVERYLREALGIDTVQREKLERRLFET